MFYDTIILFYCIPLVYENKTYIILIKTGELINNDSQIPHLWRLLNDTITYNDG